MSLWGAEGIWSETRLLIWVDPIAVVNEWIWRNLNSSRVVSESEGDRVKPYESEWICHSVKLHKAAQICSSLQGTEWVRADLSEIGWIWVRLSEFGLEWMDLNKSERIWTNQSKSERSCVNLSEFECVWMDRNMLEWHQVHLNETVKILWIWANLREPAWGWANLCEIARIWVSQSKSEWDWVDLGETNEWIWTNLNETEWIWASISDTITSIWVWVRLSEFVRVRCKTPSKTSETPPFPPISYPALAGLIGTIIVSSRMALVILAVGCGKNLMRMLLSAQLVRALRSRLLLQRV